MFYGESEHNIDEKGRVIIPVRHRSQLEDGLFVMRGLEGCIWVFPRAGGDALKQQLEAGALPPDLERMIFAGEEASLDKQGRLTIPGGLRKHAGIEDAETVILTGGRGRLEIWQPARWEKIMAQASKQREAYGELLQGLGI